MRCPHSQAALQELTAAPATQHTWCRVRQAVHSCAAGIGLPEGSTDQGRRPPGPDRIKPGGGRLPGEPEKGRTAVSRRVPHSPPKPRRLPEHLPDPVSLKDVNQHGWDLSNLGTLHLGRSTTPFQVTGTRAFEMVLVALRTGPGLVACPSVRALQPRPHTHDSVGGRKHTSLDRRRHRALCWLRTRPLRLALAPQ